LTPEEVSRRTFATVFRGFDPQEVRAYLHRVSDELGVARERQRHLEHLLADAQSAKAAPRPDLDEAALTAALGEETARVLTTARQAAADMKAKAQDNAEKLLRQGHEDAARIRAEAEGVMGVRTQEANEVAEAIRTEAEAEAEATLGRAGQEAERILGTARDHAREMLEEAKEVRAKMLADVLRRRNVARVQVAQLRAGRERLLDAYRMVRETLDQVTDELGKADEEARIAAAEAGHRLSSELGATLEADLASLELETATELGPIESAVEPTPEVLAAVATIDTGEPEDQPPPSDLIEGLPEAELDVVEPPAPIEAVRVLVPKTEEEPPEPEPEPEPEPAPVAEAPPEPVGVEEPEPDPEPAQDQTQEGDADELFARIRADREAAVERAREVLGDPTAGTVATAGDVEKDTKDEQTPSANGSTPSEATGEDALFQARDEQLGPIQAQLAKRLKRAMQDEQNDVLDRVRVHRGRPAIDDVLPPLASQADRYRAVSKPLLEQAGRAGAGAAGNVETQLDVDDLVGQLADAVAEPLRSRLGSAFADAERDNDDEAAVTERIGAAYREWKIQRIERLAGDQIVAAYSRGVFAATPAGAALRWIDRDLDGPCPDCDDNALAGPTPRGDAYPTGQHHPPAHSGCRCLLVPAGN
jgi:DivIVA domain-containing protein